MSTVYPGLKRHKNKSKEQVVKMVKLKQQDEVSRNQQDGCKAELLFHMLTELGKKKKKHNISRRNTQSKGQYKVWYCPIWYIRNTNESERTKAGGNGALTRSL